MKKERKSKDKPARRRTQNKPHAIEGGEWRSGEEVPGNRGDDLPLRLPQPSWLGLECGARATWSYVQESASLHIGIDYVGDEKTEHEWQTNYYKCS